MRYTKFIVVGAVCAVLPSCGLIKSVARVPGSLLQAVGRTAGMNVNHEEAKEDQKTELQKQEEEANKVY